MNESVKIKLHSDVINETKQKHMFLIFSLWGLEIGVDLLRVKEVLGIQPVLNTASKESGTIHRGEKILPVINLGPTLGIEGASFSERSIAIIADVLYGSDKIQVAITVDSLLEAINIADDEITRDGFSENPQSDCIIGFFKSGGSEKILLNIDRVFAFEKAAGLRRAA